MARMYKSEGAARYHNIQELEVNSLWKIRKTIDFFCASVSKSHNNC